MRKARRARWSGGLRCHSERVFLALACSQNEPLRAKTSCALYNFEMPFSEAQGHKKSPPPDSTNQEAAYLKDLAEKQKPIRVKLVDGEVVHGWVEYYDRNMIRITRQGKPNLFIFKNQIAYLAEDGG